jgi:hypothetical protein
MSKGLEIYIERCLVIDDYTYHAGRRAITDRAPDDCSPAEPEELDDITGHWDDTKEPLTDKEFEAHQTTIEEALLVQIHSYQEDRDEPRDD